MVFEGRHKIEPLEFRDRITKGSNAGQDDLVRSRQVARVRGDLGSNAQMLKRLLDAPQISHPVVDDVQHSVALWGPQLSRHSSHGAGSQHARILTISVTSSAA